jgi:Ankyrin repeat
MGCRYETILGQHTEIAKTLIEAGANLNIRSSERFLGKAALALAEDGGQWEVVALLERKGAVRTTNAPRNDTLN